MAQHARPHRARGHRQDDYDDYDDHDHGPESLDGRYTSPQHLRAYAGEGYADPDYELLDHDDQPPLPPLHADAAASYLRHPREPYYEPDPYSPPHAPQTASTYIPTGARLDYPDDSGHYEPLEPDPLRHSISQTLRDITLSAQQPAPPSPPSHAVSKNTHPRSRPLPAPPSIDTSRKSLSRREQKQLQQDELFAEVENAVLTAGTPAAYSPRRSPHPAHHDTDQLPGAEQDHTRHDYEAEGRLAALRAADDDDDDQLSLHQRASLAHHPRNHSLRPNDSSTDIAGAMTPRTSRRRELTYDDATDSTLYFYPAATVGAGDQGGLAEPGASDRRASYDDGDEYCMTEDPAYLDSPLDPSYYPPSTPTTSRPLPPPPPFSPAPKDILAPPTPVPRSASMLQPPSSPSISQPARSRTDADARPRRHSRNDSSNLSATPLAMDLPILPSKRFVPSKLTTADFDRCKEPWSLGALRTWLDLMVASVDRTELKESMIKEALVFLFVCKVPTMNIADAEVLSDRVVADMYATGTLRQTEEWVKLCQGEVGGVLYQLTGTGCYSPAAHDYLVSWRCYSKHCQRTLRVADLSAPGVARTSTDWASFYNLTKAELERVSPKEVERQNVLHEIVNTEHDFMEQLDILQQLYRAALLNSSPPVIAPQRKMNAFIRDVFGKVDAIKQANRDQLLARLKYRQDEQGPWIKGYSDLFRQWIRVAKTAYIDYAAGFPAAVLMMRQEIERNLTFRAFLDQVRNNKRSGKLGWDTYLKAPITRLQRYGLLLATVHKIMKEESEEKMELQIAMDEIRAVTLECDSRVAEMQRKVDLADWNQKLVLRPDMKKDVELNLDHLGRELVYRGDLQRTGGSRFNWLDCHALLFDNYFVLAKTIAVVQKGTGARLEKYDVSRLPIPMDLLVLDSINDAAVMKSTYVGGLTSVTTIPSKSTTPDLSRLSRTITNATSASSSPATGPGNERRMSLHHTSSAPPMITNLAEASKDQEKIVYPFKIKHLGRREPYVLFAPTAANRAEWANKIIEAKTKHAKSLHAQNAEPFRLRVIADSAFAFDYAGVGDSNNTNGVPPGVTIYGTPLDRAVRDVEVAFHGAQAPSPVCRAKVNCATTFTAPGSGKQLFIVGSDYGVYLCPTDNPRGWTKVLNMAKVTQLAVLEDMNLLLLISNGALISHHLDVVCTFPPTPPPPATTRNSFDLKSNRNSFDLKSSRNSVDFKTNNAATLPTGKLAPQKLSGSKDVNFFAAGRMKDDRMLIVYKKKDGMSSTFKVLEPIYSKGTEKPRRTVRSGSNKKEAIARTESFREYDEFSIPADCSGISLFNQSMAVSTTSRGFEVLNLEKKQPFSVPDVRAPEVASIAKHVESQPALGMLRLSAQEFLVCYERCAVYINKHGDVSRSVIMNFVGRARAVALHAGHLVLFDSDFVEVRDAQNGRLRQVIAGREVKCLDDGMGARGGATVKFAMQHPENERVQVLLEMLVD